MATQLQQILGRGQHISVSELRNPINTPLVLEIQGILCDSGLLDPVVGGDENQAFGPVRNADGRMGPNTQNAIAVFHRYAQLEYTDQTLRPAFFQALLQTLEIPMFPLDLEYRPGDDPQTKLAKRILRYMRKKDYWIALHPDTLNIVYVEGVNQHGEPNADRANEWNDRRLVIQILPGGQPRVLVNDQATTEPGRFYTSNPLNSLGAARIAFGQYKAWINGKHKDKQPALVQVGNIRLHRDLDQNGIRSQADPIVVGNDFGINQHSTESGRVPAFVDKYSAGCLVGRRYRWHLSFMQTVRRDIRYLMHKDYRFMTTVINGEDMAREEPL